MSANRVRLPDVCVVPADRALEEDVRTTPPLIAIEILSPDDRMHRVIRRLEDFRQMGVEHLWLLDPVERVAYSFGAGGLKLVDTTCLTLPDSPVSIDLPELFAALD